jgi:hypothetical protein
MGFLSLIGSLDKSADEESKIDRKLVKDTGEQIIKLRKERQDVAKIREDIGKIE